MSQTSRYVARTCRRTVREPLCCQALVRAATYAYAEGAGLPDVQPGADRAHRRHAPGRDVTHERLSSLHPQRTVVMYAIRCRIRPSRLPVTGQSG